MSFSGIIVPEQWKCYKGKENLLASLLSEAHNQPGASNLPKPSHTSEDTSCSNTADCKGTPSTQHSFACLLQPHFYTESYFLHIHPHHTWDLGKTQVSAWMHLFQRACAPIDCLLSCF